MGKAVPITSFRRATRPTASAVAAFVELGDAPGDTPAPMTSELPHPHEVEAAVPTAALHAVLSREEPMTLAQTPEPVRTDEAEPPAQASTLHAISDRQPAKIHPTAERVTSNEVEAPASGTASLEHPATVARTPSKWRRKTLVRTDGRELRKQTIYLDAELSHRLTIACAENQYDLSEAIEEAVNFWLKKRG